MRVLFYYRGIENLGVGYCMSMLKVHGHEIDLIFDPGLDDNLFLKAPHLAWLNRHEVLLERAKSFKPDWPAATTAVFLVLPAAVDVAPPPIAEPGDRRGPDPPHTRPLLRGPPLALA